MMNVELSRGQLHLTPTREHWPLHDLLGFAERINPKRAFLFVSKVLGRHIPVAPSEMRRAFSDLAAQIPDDLPEPILLIGMAETAVGLAAGVHQVLQQRYPNALFLATTRHPIDAPLLAEFREEHSHAPAHLLYGSTDPAIAAQLAATRTLILVDDEASTGQTFINLTHALRQSHLPELTHVVTAVLADWAPPLQFAGLQHHAVNLLAGTWQWHATPNVPDPNMPVVDSVAVGAWPVTPQHTWGRTPTLTPQLALHATATVGERILVLGSNEFVWPPFFLAEQLAAQGAQVKFSATTRSPIALGHSIQHCIAFSDHYGLGMPNFVYNVDPTAYDRIILAIETDPAGVDPRLRAAIPQLEVIGFGATDKQGATHAG